MWSNDHSKKWTSSKNSKKGKNFYKKSVLFLILAGFIFFRCDFLNNDENNENNETNETNEVNEVKLLEIKNLDDGSFSKYEYDEQLRLVQISKFGNEGNHQSTHTLIYHEEKSIDLIFEDLSNPQLGWTREFTKIENEIAVKETLKNGDVSTSKIELDNYELPIKWEKVNVWFIDYLIFEENLLEHKLGFYESEYYPSEYSYDNNKSPFYNCKTPKWFMFCWFEENGSKNNVTEKKWTEEYCDVITKYEYIYDSDNFPTKCTITNSMYEMDNPEEVGNTWINTVEYKYK